MSNNASNSNLIKPIPFCIYSRSRSRLKFSNLNFNKQHSVPLPAGIQVIILIFRWSIEKRCILAHHNYSHLLDYSCGRCQKNNK